MCFKSTRENLYFKVGEEKNERNVAESSYTLLTTPDKVEKYVELIEKMPEVKIFFLLLFFFYLIFFKFGFIPCKAEQSL